MKQFSQNKTEQIKIIKERLNTEYQSYSERGGNIYSLLTALNKEYGFELNYDTLRKTLNTEPGTTTLDFFCVLALCRYWKLDTAYILSPPDNRTKPMPSAESQMSSGKYVVLDDPDYLGTYYGYLMSNKPGGDQSLHLMRLKIENTHSGFSASLTIQSTVTYTDRTEPLRKHLHGTPIVSTFNHNIAILLTDDIGNLVFLYTEYKQYLAHEVYYRKGIAVTSASSSEREPLMQAFVLFGRPIPREKLAYIPGLLLPPQNDFPITKASMEQLRTDHPLLQQFYEEFHYLLEHHLEQVYLINETVILSEQSSMSKEDRIRALLLLKEKSLAVNRFFFTPAMDYAAFSKLYMQTPGSPDTGQDQP